MERDTILKLLAGRKAELERLGVKSLSLFGSFARGEEKPTSDVDILVEFSRPVGYFAYMDVKEYLEKLLRRKVDLVTPDALKRQLRDRILSEAVRAA